MKTNTNQSDLPKGEMTAVEKFENFMNKHWWNMIVGAAIVALSIIAYATTRYILATAMAPH